MTDSQATIIAAIIGAIIAIIVSIISLVTALITAYRNEKSNRDLEKIRLDNEKIKMKYELNKEAIEMRISSINKVCTALQTCRDEIRIFVENMKKGRTQDPNNLLLASKNIVDIYRENHPSLEIWEREMFHRVKNQVVQIISIIESIKFSKKYNKEMIEQLLILEKALHDTQQELLEMKNISNVINILER
jgi:hypothetical protein